MRTNGSPQSGDCDSLEYGRRACPVSLALIYDYLYFSLTSSESEGPSFIEKELHEVPWVRFERT